MNDYTVYCPHCYAEIGIPDPWNASVIVCQSCRRESVLNYDESVDEDGDETYWFYLESAQHGVQPTLPVAKSQAASVNHSLSREWQRG